jgi:hypothetical protein
MASLTERMIGAAKLDAATYEEIESDPSSLGQAMTVVALAAVASGIGGLSAGLGGLIVGVVYGLIGWFIWAGIVFVVGTKFLAEPETKSDLPEMLRTVGFAASPGVLNVFGIIPFLGRIVGMVVVLWELAAMVVAVRQALDYKDTGKAIVVCLIGWIVYVVFAWIVGRTVGMTI